MIGINTNLNNLLMRNNLRVAENAVYTALHRMSSGYKINCAKDNAAGMFIASSLSSQINGIKQAKKNLQDGVSLLQTAEGAYSNINNILLRLRDLSVQASNGMYSKESRNAMQREADELLKELEQIQNCTTFNGKNLLKTVVAQNASVASVLASGGGC